MKNIIIFVFLSSFVYCTEGKQEKTGLEGKLMPTFDLLLLDSSTHLNTNKIQEGRNVVFFYFSPVCPYCRAQTAEIVDEMKSFETVEFYMLSVAPFALLKDYSDHYELNKYPNVTVANDYTNYFENYFRVPGVPYLVIYNKSKRVKQVLIGKVNIDVIKKIAANN